MKISAPSTTLASLVIPILDSTNLDETQRMHALDASALNRHQIDGHLNVIPMEHFCRLLDELVRVTGDEAFGMHAGAKLNAPHLGLIGQLAITAETLVEAIDNMRSNFFIFQSNTHFGLHQEEDLLWLSYAVSDNRIPPHRQNADMMVTIFINFLRSVLGSNWSPVEVRFQHGKPEAGPKYEKHFGCPIQFGRRINAIGINPRHLNAVMPKRDAQMHRLLKGVIDHLAAQRKIEADFGFIVKQHILMLMGSEPVTSRQVAQSMLLSEAQFLKLVRTKKLGFHDLVKQTRFELARHYLDQPDISLTEISLLLGYSELSAFSRAFRRMSGETPQQYRQQSGNATDSATPESSSDD
jgi:AraC-like DNA-binding protein